jgi:RNA recognition motif-containing protein
MIIKISLPELAWKDLDSFKDDDMIEKIIRANFFARTKEFIYDYYNLGHLIRARHTPHYKHCHLPYSLIVDIEETLSKNYCFIEFEEVEYMLSYIIMLFLAESAEAKRYQLYFNYIASKKTVPERALLDPALYICVRLKLTRSDWRSITNHGLSPDGDINEAMELIFGVNFFERYQDIINDYKNGIMQKTFNQLGNLDYRGAFLASDLVQDMRFKLDNDAPELSIGDALSYLLIKMFQEGLKKEYGKPDRKIVN